MWIWSWLFRKNFFVYFTITLWFLAFVYFCIKPAEKIYLGGELQKAIKKSKQAVLGK